MSNVWRTEYDPDERQLATESVINLLDVAVMSLRYQAGLPRAQ